MVSTAILSHCFNDQVLSLNKTCYTNLSQGQIRINFQGKTEDPSDVQFPDR